MQASFLLIQAARFDNRDSLVYGLVWLFAAKALKDGLDNQGGDKTAMRDSGCYVYIVTAQSEGQDLTQPLKTQTMKGWEPSRATNVLVLDDVELPAT